MPAIPFMLIKPLIEKYIPYLIGGLLIYALAIGGIFYQLDGWHVFFSIVGLTFLSIALIVYMVIREVKAQMNQMQKMMQGLQSMFMGAGEGSQSGGVDLSALMGALGGAASTMAIASSVDANGDKVVMETASLTAEDGTTLNAQAILAEDHDGHKMAAMHVDGMPTVMVDNENSMINDKMIAQMMSGQMSEISEEDLQNAMKNMGGLEDMMAQMFGGGGIQAMMAQMMIEQVPNDEAEGSTPQDNLLSNVSKGAKLEIEDVEVKEIRK